MKKILSILLIVSLMCACTITAYADETTEPIETPSEPSELPSEPSEPESEPITPTEPSEPSEPSSEPSEPITEPEQTETETGEPDAVEPEQVAPETTTPEQPETPTVNVSQESIMAIADAVGNDDGMLTLTLPNGVTYKMKLKGEEMNEHEENFLRAVEACPYMLLYAGSDGWGSGNIYFYMSTPGRAMNLSEGGFSGPSCDEFTNVNFDKGAATFKVNTHYFRSSRPYVLNSYMVWSNFHVIDEYGNLHHASDVPMTYMISFNTGFEDLVVEDMTSLNLTLPELTYEGYKFSGWYLDEAFTLPYTSDYIFIDATTLYAKWTPYRTVTIITGFDDYTVEPIQILSGDRFILPAFKYPDFSFVGAYTSEDFNPNSQFYSNAVVEEDITLYLQFEQINYGALFKSMLDRMEGLVYVQMASIIMLIALLIVSIFFKRGHGAS